MKSVQTVDSSGDDSDGKNSDLDEEEAPFQKPSQQLASIAASRPKREIRKPVMFPYMVAYALPIIDDDVPFTYREDLKSTESVKWKKALDGEMESLY